MLCWIQKGSSMWCPQYVASRMEGSSILPCNLSEVDPSLKRSQSLSHVGQSGSSRRCVRGAFATSHTVDSSQNFRIAWCWKSGDKLFGSKLGWCLLRRFALHWGSRRCEDGILLSAVGGLRRYSASFFFDPPCAIVFCSAPTVHTFYGQETCWSP